MKTNGAPASTGWALGSPTSIPWVWVNGGGHVAELPREGVDVEIAASLRALLSIAILSRAPVPLRGPEDDWTFTARALAPGAVYAEVTCPDLGAPRGLRCSPRPRRRCEPAVGSRTRNGAP